MKAYFKDIQDKLTEAIKGSKSTIDICVAWFTNRELLGLLIDKMADGVSVQIISNDNPINHTISFVDFLRAGGVRLACPSRGTNARFLHEKFALFDDQKVIVGSYNWTYAAEYRNYESILVSDDALLVQQYRWRFDKLLPLALPISQIAWATPDVMPEAVDEEQLRDVEMQLEQAFLDTLSVAENHKIKMDYQRIKDKIKHYGAIGAAKRLLSTGADMSDVQAGFIKLHEAGLSDRTFEHIILQEPYQKLFTQTIRDTATKRLRTIS